MKDRYDGSPGKDAAMCNLRQRRYESEHLGKDQFVKKQQAELDKYAGRPPVMPAKLMEFNAEMQNTGGWAQEFGKRLTKGLDKVAFPVDGQGDDS
jgi:hypothetical protein